MYIDYKYKEIINQYRYHQELLKSQRFGQGHNKFAPNDNSLIVRALLIKSIIFFH